MRLLLRSIGVLMLLACGGEPPKPPGGTGDTTLPDTAVVDPDDTIDTDLYHVDPDDTIIKAPVKPDTLRPTPSAFRLPSTSGLPVGPTLYLPDDWCDGFVSGTVVSGQPDRVLATLKKADACQFRVTFTVPRMWMTANGQQTGDFSPARAKNAIDQIAKVLRNVPASYQDNLIYYSVLDDMGCTHCWGGRAITKDQTAAHTKYARQKFPSWVAVGLRVDPGWMLGRSDWGVDVAVAQWHKKKGPKNLDGVPKQKAWYESVRLAAPKVGVDRIIYAVNVHDCGGGSTPACTPSELRTFGDVALDFDPPRNCGFLAWRFDGVYFQQPAYQDAWKYLVAKGRAKAKVECKA